MTPESVVPMKISGSTALVVGAGGGIGSAVAVALARSGVYVHVADRAVSQAEAIARAITASGGHAQAHAVDLTDEQSVEGLFRAIDHTGRPAEILVNSAGAITYAPMVDLEPVELRRMIDVNLTGTFLCVREAARRMIDLGGGRIINIASTASFVAPRLAATAYSMTKGGVRQLTVAAASELAEHQICVNAVAPGTTRTAFVQGTLDTEEQMAAAAAKIPLGRVAEPEDVIGAVLFFASDFANYVTGQTLLVDGGRTTRSA